MNDPTLNGWAVRHLLHERRKRGLHPATARELAEALEPPVSESYMSHLLAGRKHAPDRIPDIAALLGVTDWRAIAMPRIRENAA